MKEIVTKVDIKVSDDGGSCDPACEFFLETVEHESLYCAAFEEDVPDRKRCIRCMSREDVTYQIPVVE